MYILEDVMQNSERQQAGIGPGAKDSGMQNVAVSTGTETQLSNIVQPQLPFEIQVIVSQISDIFVKLCDIRKQFEAAMENPSVNKMQKAVLERITDDYIDKANQVILGIPIQLNKMNAKGNRVKSVA